MTRDVSRNAAKTNFQSEIRDLDWDFVGEYSDGISAFHWYPARFIPQVPAILIGYFSDVGDCVLDPFCGSGTTLTEGWRLGRSVLGIDTNPAAIAICDSKLATPYESRDFDAYLRALGDRIGSKLPYFDAMSLPDQLELAGIQRDSVYWYHEQTLLELLAIQGAINEVNGPFREAFSVCLSAILRTVSSQDKHWGWICDNVRPTTMIYKNALAAFLEKCSEYSIARAKLESERYLYVDVAAAKSQTYHAYKGQASEVLRALPDESVDLVVTSPPYFGTTDYVRSQRLSSMWFGWSIDEMKTLETGARYKRGRRGALAEYLKEMTDSFAAVRRVVKSGSYCCIVIGESPAREPYLEEFLEMTISCGFDLVDVISRKVPKQRTFQPHMMQEEVVIARAV